VQAAAGAPLSTDGAAAGAEARAASPLEDSDANGAPGRRRRVTVLACVAAFVLAADIATKAIVVAHLRENQPVHLLGNVFELWLTRNPGAAFSVGTGETAVFTIIAFGVIVYIARTARKLYSLGWAIALGLLLGGAAGNLGDRIFRAPGLFRGDVVDWIGVVPKYYPIFNLADSSIVCGGILMVILAMRGYHLDGTRSVEDARDAAQSEAPVGPEPHGPETQAGADTETVRPAEQ
jgi:signal peptidase II